MLLVVPLAAYRSLEGEIDDGTLELLSITALSPKQIVFGKLASAMLQMLLYFVVLFPCISYAYTLRGVDFPTTVALLAMLTLAGILMTIVALFFAPLSQSRTGRVAMLLVVIMLLFGAEWVLGLAAYELITFGNLWANDLDQGIPIVGGVVLLAPALGYLFVDIDGSPINSAQRESIHEDPRRAAFGQRECCSVGQSGEHGNRRSVCDVIFRGGRTDASVDLGEQYVGCGITRPDFESSERPTAKFLRSICSHMVDPWPRNRFDFFNFESVF